MTNTLQISPEAVRFINDMFGNEEEQAIVIVGVVLGTVHDWSVETPLEEFVEVGRKTIRELPPRVMVEYRVTTCDLKRLPKEDVYVVSGIKCYLPDGVRQLIGSRKIVVEDGELQFAPKLEPREVEFSKPSED